MKKMNKNAKQTIGYVLTSLAKYGIVSLTELTFLSMHFRILEKPILNFVMWCPQMQKERIFLKCGLIVIINKNKHVYCLNASFAINTV